jgi:hypothetical protein
MSSVAKTDKGAFFPWSTPVLVPTPLGGRTPGRTQIGGRVTKNDADDEKRQAMKIQFIWPNFDCPIGLSIGVSGAEDVGSGRRGVESAELRGIRRYTIPFKDRPEISILYLGDTALRKEVLDEN